jgi:hypothetical protein
MVVMAGMLVPGTKAVAVGLLSSLPKPRELEHNGAAFMAYRLE